MKFERALEIVMEERQLKAGTTGLIVFDIDDTLLKADSSVMGIVIQKFIESKGKWEQVDRQSSEEFAKSQYKDDNARPKPGYRFDYSEFRDPEKIKQSFFPTKLENGKMSKGAKPIIANLRMMDSNLRAGYDVAFLTARGAESDVFRNLMAWLKYRKVNGQIVDLRKEKFNLKDSRAVNDDKYAEEQKGMTDPQKKAEFLKKVCKKYSIVKFVDDDAKNVRDAKALGIPNLQVIQAQGVEHNERIQNRDANK